MRTITQFKKGMALLFFVLTFSTYNAQATEKEDEQHSDVNIWSGVYQGFIPCDDCRGVKTSLALNKNNSYILITQYIGKSDREIVEKGKAILDDDSHKVVLTPRNSSQTRQYLVSDNTLIQLDSDGNRFTGKAAERYVLRKAELSEKQTTSHH